MSWWWKQNVSPKHWYISTTLPGVSAMTVWWHTVTLTLYNPSFCPHLVCARVLSERDNIRRLVVGSLLALDAVCSGECFPTYQMNVVSPSTRIFRTVFASIWRIYLRSKRRYPFTRRHSAEWTSNLARIHYFSDRIYLLTATGLSPGGSSTVHIYTQTIHRTTQITTEQHK